MPPKLILKKYPPLSCTIIQVCPDNGSRSPVDCYSPYGFRSPSEVHSQTTRISPFSKRRLSARRIESYLLFIIGLIYCLHHKPQAAFCQALFFVKSKNFFRPRADQFKNTTAASPMQQKNCMKRKFCLIEHLGNSLTH